MRSFLLAFPLVLASCGTLRHLGQEEPKPNELQKQSTRQIIGRIASVSEAGKFVLIQKYGPGKLPKNSLFQTHGANGSSANIRPTGERIRDFFAADLIAGKVQKGDAVSSFRLQPESPVNPAKAESKTQSEESERSE
ncbi:MAG: hypothetical protein ACON5H_04125 [Akkermansiaceae bacterium]